MAKPGYRVRVELIEIREFLERYPGKIFFFSPPSPVGAGTVAPTVSACARNDASPTFETTGDPLLLIGRRGGRSLQDDRVVSFDLDSFQ